MFGENGIVPIEAIINAIFDGPPSMQRDGIALLLVPASSLNEKIEMLLNGISECSKYPVKNPDCSELANYLLEFLQITEQWEKVIPVLKKAAAVYSKKKSYKDARFGDSYSSISTVLGVALHNTENLEGAIRLFRKVLSFDKSKNPDSNNTVDSLNNLANALLDKCQFKEALELFNQALEAADNNSDITIDLLAKIHNNIAYMHKEQDNFQLAEEFYLKSLLILDSSDDYLAIGTTIFNLARVEMRLKKDAVALKHLESALELVEGRLDEGHTLIEVIKKNMKLLINDK